MTALALNGRKIYLFIKCLYLILILVGVIYSLISYECNKKKEIERKFVINLYFLDQSFIMFLVAILHFLLNSLHVTKIDFTFLLSFDQIFI